MKISHSIQRRVFVIFGSFTLLLTLVYSGMNLIIAYIVEDEVLEKVLAYEAQVIDSTFQKEGRIIQPRVDYMKLYLEPENAPKEIVAVRNNVITLAKLNIIRFDDFMMFLPNYYRMFFSLSQIKITRFTKLHHNNYHHKI